MAVGWFVVPYKRRNPGEQPPTRYCGMDDFTAAIVAAGGSWDETEILGDVALVKVSTTDAIMATIRGAPGVFSIPERFFRLEDSFADLTSGERNQIQSAILSLGTPGGAPGTFYTQAEIDAAMGNTLALWRTKSLDDLFNLVTLRRLRPRYIPQTDTIVCDGPVQPVKSHRKVNAAVA